MKSFLTKTSLIIICHTIATITTVLFKIKLVAYVGDQGYLTYTAYHILTFYSYLGTKQSNTTNFKLI